MLSVPSISLKIVISRVKFRVEILVNQVEWVLSYLMPCGCARSDAKDALIEALN